VANVPVYRERQVNVRPVSSFRRQTASTPQSEGAGVGAALAGFGDTLAQAGLGGLRLVQQQIEDERLRADRTAVTEAETRLGELEFNLLDAPDGAFNTQKGRDALGIRDSALSSFDEQAALIEGSLTSQRQKDAFAVARDRRRLGIQGKIANYTTQQLDAYETGVAKAGINTAASLAVTNAGNPARIAEELSRMEAIVTQHAGRLGLESPEERDAFLADIRSKVHVGVIDRLLAQGQSKTAQAYFEEVKGQIQGEELAKVERAMQVDTTKAQAQEAFDRIEAQGGTFAEKRDKAKAIDDPEVRDATLQYIEHEELIQERQERDANEARSRAVYDVLDTGKGIKAIPSSVWAEMSGPERSAARSYANSIADHGAAAIKTDMGTLYDLITLSSVNTDKFLKLNLMSYRNKLSNADLEQMMRKQADMRGGNAASEIFATEGIQNEVIDAGLAQMGLDMTPAELKKDPDALARINAFRRAVREAVDREGVPGKKPTRAEIQAIVDTLAAETGSIRQGWFSSRPAYAFEEAQAQVESVSQVPIAERRKIEAALQRNRIPVTDARIVQLFNAQLQKVRKDR
jgi:hypothetical protein